MSRTRAALAHAARPITSFSPASMPPLARANYARELTATLLLSVTLAAIDDNVVSSIVRKYYDGVIGDGPLNFIVALLGSMTALANILSFIWVTASHGKPKVRFINALQVGTVVLVAAIALSPRTPAGAILFASLVVLARICWSGIITLRPTIWRANYPAYVRSRMVGKFSTIQVFMAAALGLSLGAAMDAHAGAFRIAMPAAAAVGLGAAAAYSSTRVRRERTTLREERASAGVMPPWRGPAAVVTCLRKDPWWARFMLCMFTLGMGNIMLGPMVIITLREQFHVGYLGGIAIASSIPAIATAASVPLWARLLDRSHVVRFRARHSWVFVAATGLVLCGMLLARIELVFAGTLLMGLGYGGGSIAWNLGHTHFAPPAQTSLYMATHVTLNGLRGLIAPFLAVTVYESLKAAGVTGQYAAAAVTGIAFALSIIGSTGFVSLARRMGTLAHGGGHGA